MSISNKDYTYQFTDFYKLRGIPYNDYVLDFGDKFKVHVYAESVLSDQYKWGVNQADDYAQKMMRLAHKGLIVFRAYTRIKVGTMRDRETFMGAGIGNDELVYHSFGEWLRTPSFDEMVRMAAEKINDEWLNAAVGMWFARRIGVRDGTLEADEKDIPCDERYREAGMRRYSGETGKGDSEIWNYSFREPIDSATVATTRVRREP